MKKDKKNRITLKIQQDFSKSASSFKIQGAYHAYFPFQPYPQQQQLITSIQQAIYQNKNALIESPTGTGKTLCLLVGALSSFVDESEQQRAKIFYLTRTHSQISQVIQQLKRTSYKCKVNIIGSRDHMCINPAAYRQGLSIQKSCLQLCNKKMCVFRNFTNVKQTQPLDVQQLKELGKKQSFCPYYYSKQMTQKTQLTILPFNYILDQNLLQKNHINIQNAVLIFDQAHNVDSISEQASSLEITQNFVKQCLNQVKTLLRIMKPKNKKDAKNDNQSNQVQMIKLMLQNFILKLGMSQIKIFTQKGDILKKISQLTSFFDTTINQLVEGINLSNFFIKIQQWKGIVKHFYKKELIVESYQSFLRKMNRICHLLISKKGMQQYLICIDKTQKSFQGKSLQLKCLSASFAFKKIQSLNPRSILLCSGTMGDLKNWERDLSIPFQCQIKVDSFITKAQLNAQIWSSQNNTIFDFSYKNKNQEIQYYNLIKKIKEIERVVQGGIVIAFSNYELMDKVLSLNPEFQKPLFCETKKSKVQKIFEQYSAQTKKEGAIIFIIMKGRFSQGINFSGQLCRCLLVVGIPFLPIFDKKVQIKKKYLQEKFSKQTGQEWYLKQAMKPINQTIGRVIRNKKDYGVIILVDQRFQKKKDILSQLPVWFREALPKVQFNNSIQQIIEFFEKKSWLSLKENTFEVGVSTIFSNKTERIKKQMKIPIIIQQTQTICEIQQLSFQRKVQASFQKKNPPLNNIQNRHKSISPFSNKKQKNNQKKNISFEKRQKKKKQIQKQQEKNKITNYPFKKIKLTQKEQINTQQTLKIYNVPNIQIHPLAECSTLMINNYKQLQPPRRNSNNNSSNPSIPKGIKDKFNAYFNKMSKKNF